MSTSKKHQATPAELTWSETHTHKKLRSMQSPWTLVLVSPPSVWVTRLYCEFRVRIARNPCSHGAEIWVSPSLLPSFPPSLFLTVFWKPWSLPLPSIHLQGHGNHSLPPSSFPPSHTLLLPHFCLLPLLCLMLLFQRQLLLRPASQHHLVTVPYFSWKTFIATFTKNYKNRYRRWESKLNIYSVMC